MKKIIALVAGRSGGHIIPALTIAKKYKTENNADSICMFTTAHSLDQSIIKKQGSVVTKHIPLKLGNVPFFNIFKILVFIIFFVRAFFKSLSSLRLYKPELVIGMGGYISIPVCLAAYLMRTPIHLYDLDAKPGKATRLLARYAQKIFICFEQANTMLPTAKTELIAYPIRFDEQAKALEQSMALTLLHLPINKKTIFINGGSQGSVFINNSIKNWLNLNPHLYSLIQIIHQTGAADATNWQRFYNELEIPHHVFIYKDDLGPCYSAADLVICRAGAGSLFETLFFKKPCLTIPLETNTTAHQKENARALTLKYPELFTMLTEDEIKQDNMVLFRVLNKYIYAQQTSNISKVGHPTPLYQ